MTASQSTLVLKVLVAEDTRSDRQILEAILRQDGHHVISASDGIEAVECFRQERPDIILLDALMPSLDGFEAARQIKSLAGETLVPIIFLTSLTETESLVKCLEAGGDDFLQKPYNRVILQAKIKAFNRMRELHATMSAQRDQIASHNRYLIQEQTLAKQLFDNIAHDDCLDASNVRHYLSPKAVFNGDVLVAAQRPSGNMMLLLGDFTGHGLPAAIGAMPLASTFYGMVHKGFALTDVLREINDKLKAILPIGLFCCATFLEINFRERIVTVWNGGLPDCFIYRHRTREVEAVKSHHLPLGVLPSTQLKLDCQYFELEVGDRCFLWSDGIHEARSCKGEMFGEQRLKAVFERSDPGRIFDAILESVHEFTGSAEVDDDLSLLEVVMVEPGNASSRSMPQPAEHNAGLMEWKLDFEVKPSTFKYFDPLPLLLSIITEVPGLRSHSGSVYTVLAELYSNALEHGVLKLDSTLKQTPEGFARYYQLRSERLEHVDSGFIRFHLSHDTRENGGRLMIHIVDSGDGFPHQDVLNPRNRSAGYSGRGIPLIRDICESLCYRGKGNEVEAVFVWSN
ncbi:fused response regulator/phosphatase [Proteobacteria bacterium 005FR1]|nr:fused response regulator/phosphatase [Proteobacteria bacterium 005FR1]